MSRVNRRDFYLIEKLTIANMKTLYADYTRGTKKTLSNQLKCLTINSEIIDSKELEQVQSKNQLLEKD